MLFRFDGVAKEFGGRKIFADVTVQANPNDRIALIGRNGCGKTTLLDMLEGRLEPDEGRIHRSNALQIARIEQLPRFEPETTVRDEALKVFRYIRVMEARLAQLETEMARHREKIPPEVASEYQSLRDKLEIEGGYDYSARTEATLLGLGFKESDFDHPCGQLSGGQVNRLLLARALLRPGNLMLLDEPTNHVDLKGILWLTDYLREAGTAFVVISHDRRFLDAVTQSTWEIESGRLRSYPAPFTQARRLKEERRRLEEREYQRQQEWKARTEEYIRRNIAGQKTRQAQSRRKRLQKTEWLERPGQDLEKPLLKVVEARRGGALSLVLRQADFGYPGKALVKGVDLVVRRGDRIAVLGANGSGKSTILRTLIGETPLLDGDCEWGPNTVPNYFSQDPSLGEGNQTVYDCLRELDLSVTDEQLRGFAARFLFRDEDIFKSVDSLSGGERSRIALARLLYHPANVLILDEPTNHLDIPSREALEAALSEYEGTLLIVSHDLYFVDRVARRFFLIQENKLVSLEKLDHLSAALSGQGPLASRSADNDAISPKAEPTTRSGRSGARLSKNERARREKKVRKLEKKIEALEKEKRETLRELEGRHDFARLHDLSERHQEIEDELAGLYEAWEAVAAELEVS